MKATLLKEKDHFANEFASLGASVKSFKSALVARPDRIDPKTNDRIPAGPPDLWDDVDVVSETAVDTMRRFDDAEAHAADINERERIFGQIATSFDELQVCMISVL